MKKSKILALNLMALLALTSCEKTSRDTTAAKADNKPTQQTTTSKPTEKPTTQNSATNSQGGTSTPSSSVKEEYPVADENQEVVIKNAAYPALVASQMGTASKDGIVLNSVFTLMNGVTMEASSAKTITVDGESIASGGRIKLNGKGVEGDGSVIADHKKSIQINASGAGKFRFFATSANNSDGKRTYAICKEDGTNLFTSATGVSSAGVVTEYTFDITEAGTYYLYSPVNGFNIYYLDFVQITKLGKESGFEIISKGVKSEYLIGDTLSTAGLIVNVNYASGTSISIDSKYVDIDTSKVDMTKAGTYEVAVNFRSYPAQKFNVTVHAVKGIEVITSTIQDGVGAKTWKKTPTVYPVGATVDTSNIIVRAITDADTKMDITSKATFAAVDTSTLGKKNLTVNYTNDGISYTGNVELHILNANQIATTEDSLYTAKVDASVETGTFVDALTFKTVQEAVDFMELAAPAEATKLISIKGGTYHEKVYINGQNIKLVGAADYSKVKIQNGDDADSIDALGQKYSTYGSGTVMVSRDADGFEACGISFINNKFTSMAEYDASKDGNKQATAMTCDADKVIVTNCGFYGFQDTLYSTGTISGALNHQVFESCHIEGMTDFIFGEYGEFYYKNCEIKSLNKGKKDNNGYVCAPKPESSSASYLGFVFDGCNFIAEEGIEEGTVSIARPWGKEATVKTVNSILGSHISKKAYGDTTKVTIDGKEYNKNARYADMSGNRPTSAHFAEYNNTGEGALDAAVNGMTMMSKADYETFLLLLKSNSKFGYYFSTLTVE